MNSKWIFSLILLAPLLENYLVAMEKKLSDNQGVALIDLAKQERLTLQTEYALSPLILTKRQLTNIDGLSALLVYSDSKEMLLKDVLSLDLSDNMLSLLPKEIGEFKLVRDLRLMKNNLAQLPIEIGKLHSLVRLVLSNNKLTSLPLEIGNLSRLQNLYLSDNVLTEIPSEIGMLTKLGYLDLSRNKLSQLPVDVGMPKLRVLYLQHNMLKQLPLQICMLSELESLNLSYNVLSELPNEGKLVSLTDLDLSHNQLEALPSAIKMLSKLKTLKLSNNRLSELPQQSEDGQYGLWGELESLYLSHNQLSELPKQIAYLPNLGMLNLSHNKFSKFPAHLRLLPKLGLLNLSHNKIKELDGIGRCSDLWHLDLSYCDLVGLPLEITRNKYLHLNVLHNKFSEDEKGETLKGMVAIIKKLIQGSLCRGVERRELGIWLLDSIHDGRLHIGNLFASLPLELQDLIETYLMDQLNLGIDVVFKQ